MPTRTHLHRLGKVWIRYPIYFLTTCTNNRRPLLTAPSVPELLIAAWHASPKASGWMIGRYVVMPDHVHFFAQSRFEIKSLSGFLRDWKRWTAAGIMAATRAAAPIWQAEFFDHVLRSMDSYDQKWRYVRDNPVRARLVARAEDWPHAGECADLKF